VGTVVVLQVISGKGPLKFSGEFFLFFPLPLSHYFPVRLP
jgi:hypothetical protein